MVAALQLLGREGQRQPQLVLLVVGGTFAQHANDGVRLAVEPHRAPKDAAVAGKAVLPDPVREDDDFVATDDAFLLGERPAQRQRVPVAHHREKSGRGRARQQVLGPILGGHVHAAAAPRVQIAEDRGPAPPLDVVGGRDRLSFSVVLLPHHHQAVGLAVRQRREEGAVDDAEDGGGRRDAQRQRDDGDGREPGIAPEEAEAERASRKQRGHGGQGQVRCHPHVLIIKQLAVPLFAVGRRCALTSRRAPN